MAVLDRACGGAASVDYLDPAAGIGWTAFATMYDVTNVRLAPGAELRLEFADISVEVGPGAHRLGLRYQATPMGLPAGALALISGSLRLQNTLGWIGTLQADRSLPVSDTAFYPRSVVLATTISDSQLARIEADRHGADLELLVDLHVALAGAPAYDYPAGDEQDWISGPPVDLG